MVIFIFILSLLSYQQLSIPVNNCLKIIKYKAAIKFVGTRF